MLAARGLGFAPALLGPRALYWTIMAVETFVEEHYQVFLFVCVAVSCYVLCCVDAHYQVLLCVAMCCSVLQCVGTLHKENCQVL